MKAEVRRNLLQAVKFTFFSVGAGVIQIGSYALLHELLKNEGLSVNGLWAATYLPSLVLSVLFNFTLNRKYTFRSADNVPKCMALVFAFYVAFTPLSLWLGGLANKSILEHISWGNYIVEGCTMIANFVLEFLYNRFVVYRKSIDTNAAARLAAETAATDGETHQGEEISSEGDNKI